MSTELSRKSILATAQILFSNMTNGIAWATNDEESNDKYEQLLIERVESTKQALIEYRQSRAMRHALDKIMPNWKYIDASDYLPQAKWRSFVSDNRQEWMAWLLENGVPEAAAEKLVRATFGCNPK